MIVECSSVRDPLPINTIDEAYVVRVAHLFSSECLYKELLVQNPVYLEIDSFPVQVKRIFATFYPNEFCHGLIVSANV